MRRMNERAFHEKFPIYHEMYGRYFTITAELLRQAQESGQLSSDYIEKAAETMGYPETALRLPDMLQQDADRTNGLFEIDGETKITKVKPAARPLSLVERRWLATILNDPRMGLFMDDDEIARVSDLLRDSNGKNAEPLFDDDAYCRFDVGHDSDDYHDADFRKVFRTILSALLDRRAVEIEYAGYSGKQWRKQVTPLKIEYSMKHDLFRLIFMESIEGREVTRPIRIKRIERASVSALQADKEDSQKMEEVSVSVRNENSALERAHIRFANYKVSVESEGQDKRTLHISYPNYEENSLIEAILSFGPAAQVIEPENLVNKIRVKLSRQAQLLG
jgi:hypothetical protein